MTVTLLVTGDLHVGRFPSYVPASDRRLSVEHVWAQSVDLAVSEGVDAVVLTGDVADQDNKLFEALGPLRAGVDRLAAAGIPTVAVTGNHDYDALRRLSGLVDSDWFTLLGAGGRWETHVLEKSGAPALRLVGWSFPSRTVRTSPLAAFPELPPGPPTLGVVHGDLDVAASPYAPLPSAELAAAAVDGWLLGHIHRPGLRGGAGKPVLYPGSPQPLDPGERGAHGPWLVTVRPGGAVEAEPRPLATVRYDAVDADVSGATDREAVEAVLAGAVDRHLAAVHEEQPTATRVVVDVEVSGRTGAFADLRPVADSLAGQEIPGDHAVAVVRKVTLRARPDYDLAVVAERNDPAGTVARLLLDVEGGGARDLVADAARAVRGVHAATAFSALRDGDAPDDHEADARALLEAEGLALLDALLSQTPDP